MSQPYSDAQKFEVVSFVNAYNADHGKGGQNEAARRFKVSPLTIAAWLKAAATTQAPSTEKLIAGYEAAAEAEYSKDPLVPALRRNQETGLVEVIAPSEVLLSGPPANSLSPLETAALATIESTTLEARRLADLVKDYGRAGTAAKTLCGIHLRHIREFYFGPRNPNGGRPKQKTPNVSGFATWGEFLADRVGITDDTGSNWMKMAEAIEALAESKGLDLQSICQKLPWDWTPEETAAIDTTVRALTQDKTQRQLLQADFLSSLGYEEPERQNGSNNPAGKNGGKKQPAASIHESVRLRQEAARLILFGTVKPGFAERGSIALFMENFIKTDGAEVAALPKQELRDLYEHTIKDFVIAFRKLADL